MQHRRILVIGCPGSGKSRFAIELGRISALPVHHLDLLYWNADKTTVSDDVFRKHLQNILARDCWIIDGNYASSLDMRLKRCDCVFLLDYPAEVCLHGIRQRMNRPRPDMPWIETEPDPEFLEFIRGFRSSVLPDMMRRLSAYPNMKIILFRSREETDAWLRANKSTPSP